MMRKISVESRKTVGKRFHQNTMRLLLIGMSIKATECHIAYTQTQILNDSLGQHLQPGCKWPDRIGYRRMIVCSCIQQCTRTLLGIESCRVKQSCIWRRTGICGIELHECL